MSTIPTGAPGAASAYSSTSSTDPTPFAEEPGTTAPFESEDDPVLRHNLDVIANIPNPDKPQKKSGLC